jgi:hypothetical protein
MESENHPIHESTNQEGIGNSEKELRQDFEFRLLPGEGQSTPYTQTTRGGGLYLCLRHQSVSGHAQTSNPGKLSKLRDILAAREEERSREEWNCPHTRPGPSPSSAPL